MYAISIRKVQVCKYFWAFKFVRRMLSKLNRGLITRNEEIEIGNSALCQLKKWRADILSAGPRLISREKSNDMTLWSDASNTGWGAVLFDDDTQRTFVVGNRWASHEASLHINIKEARALFKALTLFDNLEQKTIQPMIDNTSTVYSLIKERSTSELLNKEVTSIFALCKRREIRLKKPQYISTKQNPADFWSRLF
eukprot:GILI01022118.1.p1 GENE.GILI01022118.1~~GILI01022118.1.p1  ORF type:complete len:196 (+),score=14.57 GILI01022118.1:193-780(+)